MADFEALYALHFREVYRFALSLCRNGPLAEEIAQETFARAMTHLRDFNGQSEVRTWLCQIAKNAYFTHCRKAKHTAPMEPFDQPDGADTPAEALADREQLLAIHRHLHEMDEPYREVFTLRVFGELSHAQIGSLFGKTEVWARTTFYRAKVRLQERIRDENE